MSKNLKPQLADYWVMEQGDTGRWFVLAGPLQLGRARKRIDEARKEGVTVGLLLEAEARKHDSFGVAAGLANRGGGK